ncbi:conserved hypothetical protein [Candidatus Nitrotoga sp. HW29]|uniref:hypothetical protein n=1 Tax=Candidatus Nitrotoga sp. HW29 TaxID=2886963 RepID=UPI001EF197F6|nr:hypothetical protein [Candidatus Nitrotoga sp. HW29]CAH1904808.1 conserved hypothetical protein [Candidatus Nitrotoga sp. HW29]
MPRQFLFTCLLSLVIVMPARAMSVLPLYLDEIINDAAIAFQGKSLENHSERDLQTGLIVTYSTFEVQEILKGEVGATHTIKQIGGKLKGETYQTTGVPTFTVGESYVLFFYGVSAAGFSSPVGLDQGKFTIIPASTGFHVTNGRDFKEMTLGIPDRLMPPSALIKMRQVPGSINRLDLDEFKQLVRQKRDADK